MTIKVKSDAGYSMIEVLVSILILSIGVLGAAGMQLAATRTTQQSVYQTMALQLAADIADTVRASVDDDIHAVPAETMLDLDYTSTPGVLPIVSVACYFTACGPREFIESEIIEWKTRLATSFPVARLRICRDANPWSEAGNTYKWDCGGEGEDASLVIKLGWKMKNPDGSYVKNSDNSFPPSVVIPVTAV